MGAETTREEAMAQIAAVRAPRPRIARELLEAFLQSKMDCAGPIEVGELQYIEDAGGSNGIALFDVASRGRLKRLVLRYAPGEQLLKQKRFDQEFFTLSAVRRHGIPAPTPRWCEPTGGAIGYPFLVMDRLDGRAPSNRMMYSAGLLADVTPAERKKMLLEAAGFHGRLRKAAIGPEDVPHLVDRGAGATAIERELSWWLQEAILVTEPGDPRRRYLTDLNRWMVDNQPRTRPPTLVHGDAQIANLMFQNGRFLAALDWELSYLGHNEADLALVVMLVKSHVPPGEHIEGLPTESELIDRYEAEAGAPVEHWEYFKLFNLVKVSTIMLMSSRYMNADMADRMWQLNEGDRKISWENAKAKTQATT
jgi:aminoglycoside phosphotransferase (APT) family kinase protein